MRPGIGEVYLAELHLSCMALFGCTLSLFAHKGNSETNPLRRKTHEHASENCE